MGKPRSRQPAHARPVRRSLVELTAAAVSSAARDGVRLTLPAPIATFFEDVEAGETAAENADQLTTSITVAPPATGHAEASAVIQLPHTADALTSSARAISNSADGNTEMAVEAVEDRRAPVLQNLKVCVSASPGDVKDIASRELPTGPALEPATQEANSSHASAAENHAASASGRRNAMPTKPPMRLTTPQIRKPRWRRGDFKFLSGAAFPDSTKPAGEEHPSRSDRVILPPIKKRLIWAN